MRFKLWFKLYESGHIMMNSPSTITVLYHNKPVSVPMVDMIDPRFEFSNYPSPEKQSGKKFLGEIDFSLPLVNDKGIQQGYLNSQRKATMTGNGSISINPNGYKIPDINWANKAEFIGSDGRTIDLTSISQEPRQLTNQLSYPAQSQVEKAFWS